MFAILLCDYNVCAQMLLLDELLNDTFTLFVIVIGLPQTTSKTCFGSIVIVVVVSLVVRELVQQ